MGADFVSGADNTSGVEPDKAGRLAMSGFAVEHLVAPAATTGKSRFARSVELGLALALNIFLFAALFYRPVYTLPPMSQEPEAISVDLVPPPQPKPQPQPQPEPQAQEPEKPKPYEFKGSGDEKLKEAGSKPAVKAEKKAPTPEKAAKKPEPDAPEQPATDLPDWMKSVEQGYDIPAPRKSSSRDDASDSDDTSDQMGDGAGDAYSNAMKEYIVNHLKASAEDYARVRNPIIIAIEVDRAGNLISLKPLAITGIRSFDQAIIKSLYDARPYAPLPPGSPETFTFRFTLKPPK
tara:strand:+ start:2946 stop:3821 length:876 start_codon:yes stop_codon:yes gene_type:complete